MSSSNTKLNDLLYNSIQTVQLDEKHLAFLMLINNSGFFKKLILEGYQFGPAPDGREGFVFDCVGRI